MPRTLKEYQKYRVTDAQLKYLRLTFSSELYRFYYNLKEENNDLAS